MIIYSLYPTISKYGEMPTCHPEIITNNFDMSLGSYWGLAKCDVLPPRGEYIITPYPTIEIKIGKMNGNVLG